MSGLWLGAAVSFLLSLGLTSWLVKLSQRTGAFISPIRPRDSHNQPTPRIGGLAIVLAFLITVIGYVLIAPEVLRFSGDLIWGIDRNLFGVIIAIILLTIINVLDDQRSVSPALRLIVQIIAASLVVYFGVRMMSLSNPLGGELLLGGLGGVLVVVWLVGLANVMNWLDGVDGLTSGVGLITLAVLLFLSVRSDVSQPANALLAALAFGAIAGFLPFNLSPARAFLGDTGSVFIGFIIGVIAVISGGKIATAFLVLAIPFLDALIVLGSRIWHRQSPFVGDRRHLHHRLLERGWTARQIIALFYAISLTFGLIALNTQTVGKLQAALAAFLLMAFLVGAYTLKTHGRGK